MANYLVPFVVFFSAWAHGESGLEYRISTDKTDYILGEPVGVTFHWRNGTGKAVRCSSLGADQILQFFHANGNHVSENPYYFHTQVEYGEMPTFTLAPGESRDGSRQISGILEQFDFVEPDTYTIASRWRSEPGESCPEMPEAPSIVIRIASWSPDQAKRYRQLALKGNQDAINIVASNGDPTSVDILAKAYSSEPRHSFAKWLILSVLARTGDARANEILAGFLKSDPDNADWIKAALQRIKRNSRESQRTPH